MEEVKKVIEEMKKEMQQALYIKDWAVANTLEVYIDKLENALN
jgi:hypothetical protein